MSIKLLKCRWLLIAITLFLEVPGIHTQGESGNLRDFVHQSMERFPDWLRANNLDPTPVVPTLVFVTNVASDLSYQIVGIVKNQVYSGISGTFTVGSSASYPSKSFGITLYYERDSLENHTITGEYELYGYFGETRLLGNGSMNLARAQMLDCTIHCNGFGVTPDGYVDLSVAEISYGINEPWWRNKTLTNLTAGSYNNLVTTMFVEAYYDEFRNWFPLPGYMRRYLEEIFAATPLSDIIGGTI